MASARPRAMKRARVVLLVALGMALTAVVTLGATACTEAAPMSISPNGTPVGPGTYVIEGVIFDVPDGARISVPYIEVQDCPDEVVCGPLIIIDDEHSESSLALEIETGVENYRIILPGSDAGSANALFDHIANSARPAP